MNYITVQFQMPAEYAGDAMLTNLYAASYFAYKAQLDTISRWPGSTDSALMKARLIIERDGYRESMGDMQASSMLAAARAFIEANAPNDDVSHDEMIELFLEVTNRE